MNARIEKLFNRNWQERHSSGEVLITQERIVCVPVCEICVTAAKLIPTRSSHYLLTTVLLRVAGPIFVITFFYHSPPPMESWASCQGWGLGPVRETYKTSIWTKEHRPNRFRSWVSPACSGAPRQIGESLVGDQRPYSFTLGQWSNAASSRLGWQNLPDTARTGFQAWAQGCRKVAHGKERRRRGLFRLQRQNKRENLG